MLTKTVNIILLVLSAFIWTVFILYVDPDPIRSDQYPIVLEYKDFVAGNYSWSEIWQNKGGHRLPGYKSLVFLNFSLFGYSAILEILFPICFLIVAIWFVIRTLVLSSDMPESLKIGLVLCLVLCFVNAQSIQLSLNSIIAMRLFNYCGFMLMAVAIWGFVSNPEKILFREVFILILLGSIVILGFGRGWGIAASIGSTALILLGLLTTFRNNSISRLRSVLALCVVIGILAIYLIGILTSSAGSGKGLDLEQLVLNYFKKLTHANLNIMSPVWAKSEIMSLVFPILYLLIVSIASLRAIWSGLDKRTWLALFMVYMALVATLVVSYKRGGQSVYFPRHNLEIGFGLVGLVYLCVNELYRLKIGKISGKNIGLGLCLLISSAIIHNGTSLIATAKSSKRYFDKMESSFESALEKLPETRREYRKLGCAMSVNHCKKAIIFLRESNFDVER